MTERENTLRAIRMERPDHIPVNFHVSPSCWGAYPHEAIVELMETHPLLFPKEKIPQLPYSPILPEVCRADAPYRDSWGCVWTTRINGMVGTVTHHPLQNWENWEGYQFPDPEVCNGLTPIDWDAERRQIEKDRADGKLVWRGLRHGHTFLQVCDIHGYQDTLFDMEDEEPRLRELLDKIADFNTAIVQKYLDMDVEIIGYGEDLGMQQGPMLSPQNFEKYFSPLYYRMMKPAVDKGTIIHMHSDGDVRTLLPYLLQNGVQIINIQDLVNGIDWIRENLKGKVCIDLDVDRQKILPFGTPAQVRELVCEEISRLGSREGGLMLTHGWYPGVPLENVKALMDVLEEKMYY